MNYLKKHLKPLLLALVLALIPGLAMVHAVGAQRFSNNIHDGETVNSSVYTASKSVTIKGTVNGDVFCAGEDVTIDATVNGDVICAAQQMTVTGTVNGDVRLAAQNLSVDAKITGSATMAAADFSLDATASIGRDLTVMGSDVNIKGAVGRDVVVSGSAVILNGQIGRNVTAQTAQLQIKNNADIAGKVDYTSTAKAEIASGAELKRSAVSQHQPQQDSSFMSGFNLTFFLMALSGMLLLSLILVLLFPRLLRKTSDSIVASAPKTMLVGFVAGIVLPIAIVMLIAVMVGIPIAIFLLLAWLLAMLLSGPITGYFVGRLVLKNKDARPVPTMLAGSAIVLAAYFVPLLGFLAVLIGYWLGLGAIVLALKDHMGDDEVLSDAPAPVDK